MRAELKFGNVLELGLAINAVHHLDACLVAFHDGVDVADSHLQNIL